MIRIQSLRNRIILQFLIIIAPLVAVSTIVALADMQRTSALEDSLRLQQLSRDAKAAYTYFVDGVDNAMDTGFWSPNRIAKLDTVTAVLNEQKRFDPQRKLDRTISLVKRFAKAVQTDSSSSAILELGPLNQAINRDLTDNQLYYRQQHEFAIDRAIDGAKRQNWTVVFAIALSLVFAIVFVRTMILDLTRPLGRAITVANRIAGGNFIAPDEVRTDHDIDGLLQSLAQMNASLNEYRQHVENHERLLERRIAERTSELGKSVERLQALAEVSQAVNSTLDLQEVLEAIVARAVQLSAAGAGTIYEFDEATGKLQLRAVFGFPPELEEAMRARSLSMGEGASGRAAATRAPVEIADVHETPDLYTGRIHILDQLGLRAVLALPLLREGRVFGSLALVRQSPGVFPPEIVELLQTFAAQSTLAIQNARLFREIEHKSRELQSASQHKSQFLANMSHELRTPLNAILGYTELIVDRIYGEVPDKISEILERVQKCGRHLLNLINDVLDMSKIEAGQLRLSLQDYSVRGLVQTAATSIESLAQEKGLKLTVDVDEDIPIAVGDERRLVQVLVNLMGNAVKFTEKGGLTVRATRSDGSLLVSVEDTGPGIAELEQQRIFEEFQQVDSSSTRAKGGTGLGLAIARRIVELHDGRLWVESVLGKGSTFYLSIPMQLKSDGGVS